MRKITLNVQHSIMKSRFLIPVVLALILCFLPLSMRFALADEPQAARGAELPLPRFVSLRADKVYARTGPALRYPVRWVYQREGLPVEIIQEFEAWRQIRDKDGQEGWVHQSLLSGTRTGLVQGDELVPLRDDPEPAAGLVAQIEPGAVVTLRQCDKNGWCEAENSGYRGWISRKSIWGIYPAEEFH